MRYDRGQILKDIRFSHNFLASFLPDCPKLPDPTAKGVDTMLSGLCANASKYIRAEVSEIALMLIVLLKLGH